MPGTTGFLGEFLVLTGSFKKNYIVAMLATIGVVLGAAYILWLTKRVIFGKIKNEQIKNLKDTNKLELAMLVSLASLVIFFGFFPYPLIETINVSVDNLITNYEQSLSEISLVKND